MRSIQSFRVVMGRARFALRGSHPVRLSCLATLEVLPASEVMRAAVTAALCPFTLEHKMAS
jgi:hypothetical protein